MEKRYELWLGWAATGRMTKRLGAADTLERAKEKAIDEEKHWRTHPGMHDVVVSVWDMDGQRFIS